ncbi:MAG: hypothetical protein ABIG93_00215 [archaeon]|nr:hypothetical protein [Nanoarchaeota archaeon]
MQISFFEEFPTKENLDKLKYVTWNTKLYLATKSLKEFEKIKKQIQKQLKQSKSKTKVKEYIYWPILEKKEGYWISPFSNRKALKRIFKEIESKTKSKIRTKPVPIMIDAELPTTKNPFLYITQFFNFLSNRKLIRTFIKNNKPVYIAEYYPEGKFKEGILSFLGLHFDPKKYNYKVIKMLYHSLHNFDEKFLNKELEQGKEEFGNNFITAFGIIAKGVSDEKHLLSFESLKQDLTIAKKQRLKEIIIFRLGGMNKEYQKVIEKFVQ